jgi:hypothetical protein
VTACIIGYAPGIDDKPVLKPALGVDGKKVNV